MTMNNQVAGGFTETNLYLAAIYAMITALQGDPGPINNTVAGTDTTYGSVLIESLIATAKSEAKIEVKAELIDGAANDFDTFIEVFTQFQSQGGDLTTAMNNIAANVTAIQAAQQTADNAVIAAGAADTKAQTALTNAATADAKAVAADAKGAAADVKAVQAQNDVDTLTTAVGTTTTDYAAIVNAGLPPLT